MNIYRAKFEGVYCFTDGDQLRAKIWTCSEEADIPLEMMGAKRFEVSLLREYQGEDNVLVLNLIEEGTKEYITLYSPWQIYDDGWKKTDNNIIQMEFVKAYIKSRQGKRDIDIYDEKFYGVYFQYKLELSGINIFIRKEDVMGMPGFDNSFFEAVLLKEYEGKKNVIKLEFKDGEIAYETLFYPYLYWDMDDKKWKKSNNIDTPEEFMKAYLMWC